MNQIQRGSLRTLLISMAVTLFTTQVQALPIGFGVNQGPMKYEEQRTPHFYVYHDARARGEGAAVLTTLAEGRAPMESWLGIKRDSPLPVVMSGVTANASFANFIMDAIELQTLGQGGRDLAWHEYVHAAMYQHLDNWFGPPGAILHLPWMPAWFLEGLAEALSVSIGSDVTAGIERYQALTGRWPSYDRLHSLYSSSFAQQGYATSGALVTYFLRQGNPAQLPELLEHFYHRSMPWWWLWAAVPFNGFMPMDSALELYGNMDGEQLYAAYKKSAKEHWTKANLGPLLIERSGRRRAFSSLSGFDSTGADLRHVVVRDGQLVEARVKFDKTSGWATNYETIQALPDDFDSYARALTKSELIAVDTDPDRFGTGRSVLISKQGQSPQKTIRKVEGDIFGVYHYGQRTLWLEHDVERNKVCSLNRESGKVSCPIDVRFPTKVRVIGRQADRRDPGQTSELWLRETTETIAGDRHRILRLNLKRGTVKTVAHPVANTPVAIAFAGKQQWRLVAERDRRSLVQIDAQGRCTRKITVADHLTHAWGLKSGHLVLGMYTGGTRQLLRVQPEELKPQACGQLTVPSSPMLAAQQASGPITLAAAMTKSSTWAPTPPSSYQLERLGKLPPLGEQPPEDATAAKPAEWRGRPVLFFPWIGAEDALGPQFGIVSLPLVDHLQNETVRATLLYGLASNFPYQELSLVSTRFRVGMSLALYRQQTWNGRFLQRSTGDVLNGYLDEKGGRFSASYGLRTLGGWLSIDSGLKYAYLQPYIVHAPFVRRGFLAEAQLGLGLSHKFGKWSLSQSLSGSSAPEQANANFDYNKLAASLTLGRSLPLSSRFSLGVEGSRTRGKKRQVLQEVYRPLKTFIPGSGGGYNRNSFPVTGVGGLFSPVFGDTQARARANFTIPVIRDVDKWLWLVYVERLDFTAFYNYGAAWRGAEPSVGWDKLIRAHGYNLDLQFENKGVRFNLGVGSGQVIGDEFQVYLTSGFDALF